VIRSPTTRNDLDVPKEEKYILNVVWLLLQLSLLADGLRHLLDRMRASWWTLTTARRERHGCPSHPGQRSTLAVAAEQATLIRRQITHYPRMS